MKLTLSGITNDVNTILGIIQRLQPEVLIIPEVKGLIEAAISTFSPENKATIANQYEEQMAKSDADHVETQKELGDAGATVPGAQAVDSSAKGGGQ